MISYIEAAVLLLVLAGVVMLGTSFVGVGQTSSQSGIVLETATLENTEENYQQFVSAELEDDKCAVPEGYSEEAWKQHMGHHPDRYEGCL